jgi:hypothetical protein
MLFRSIHAVLALPAQRNSTCATTTSPTAVRCVVTTVAEEREANIHVHTGISEDAFVAMRTHGMPRWTCRSCCCRRCRSTCAPGIAAAEANGVRYLKIPINAL